jgi:hypothetical protein
MAEVVTGVCWGVVVVLIASTAFTIWAGLTLGRLWSAKPKTSR